MRRVRNRPVENQERWLITYADLISLLLGLFIILYSTTKQDTERYKEAMAAVSQVFGSVAPDNEDWKRQATLETIEREISLDFITEGVETEMTERGLIIRMEGNVFFDSGSEILKTEAQKTLSRIAEKLRLIENPIRIEGHTDNIPMKSARFPSNWHLSTARAIQTMDYLIHKENIDILRIYVAGFADRLPLNENETPEQRSENRRIEIVLLRESDSGAPLPRNGEDD